MTNELFSSQKDWKNNACINGIYSEMSVYIDGYKTAADILSENVVENGTNQDILVYPIAFLYRQYIELQLKHLIKESRILLLAEEQGFPEHHKIQNLWVITRNLIEEIISTIDSSINEYISNEEFSLAETTISEFSKLDPDSFAFRYSEDKRGNNTMKGVTHINIRNLSERIVDLAKVLKKIDLVVGLLQQQNNEMSY
jgi:hypothetical protein